VTWSLDGQRLRRILVTRLRYLGDIAMSTVVLEVLKRGDPRLDIGYLCEAEYAPLLQGHPYLARLHALNSARCGNDAQARTAAAAVAGGDGKSYLATLAELRQSRYDLGVDLFFNPRSAMLLWLTRSRWRIGGARSWRRLLYTHLAFPPRPQEQPVFRRLAPGGLGDHLSRLALLRHEETDQPFFDWFGREFAADPPRPQLSPPPFGSGEAWKALAELDIATGDDFILLAPGATWASKEWPLLHWGALIRQLRERTFSPIVILQPPVAGSRCGDLDSLLPPGAGGVLPPLPLPEALRVTGAARLVICVDGGIMHAAVAMQRPTLALFGPTAPEIWFPYEELGPYRVICRRPDCHPCDRHQCDEFVCLPGITPESVAAAASDLLTEAEGTG